MKKTILLLASLITFVSCSEVDFETENKTSQTNSNALQSRLSQLGSGLLPITFNDDFIFGFNGHPFTQTPYQSISFLEQINKLKEHNCNFYRVELSEDTNVNQTNVQTFTNNGITLLPVLICTPDLSSSASNTSNYQAGVNLATILFQKIGNLPYYEVGNELSISCLKDSTEIAPNLFKGGSQAFDYNMDKIQKTASFLKGMIDYLKTSNPSSKIVISNGGWLQTYYFKLLQENNVNFDIIGVHWYSNMGLLNDHPDIINALETYGKPIWINEFNYYTTDSQISESTQAQWLVNFMNDLNKQNQNTSYNVSHPLIRGLFFYELYNQPGIRNDITDIEVQYVERNYGLINATDNTYELISDAYKYKIEEVKYGYYDFTASISNNIDIIPNYTNDTNWLVQNPSTFKASKNKNNLISSYFNSLDYYHQFIKKEYLEIHNRTADLSGLNYWTGLMSSTSNPMSREDVIVNFCDSQEFYDHSNNNNSTFIDNLYLKLLNRAPDSEGKAYYLNRITILGKRIIIQEFVHSREFYDKFIEKQYQNLLKRDSDASGKLYWVDQMINGMDQKTLITNFILGESFLERSIIDGYLIRFKNQPYVFKNLTGLLQLW